MLGSRRGCPATIPASSENELGLALGNPGAARSRGTLRRSRQGCLMRLLTEPLAAAGSVNLWGCRLIGGSATR